MKKSLLALGAFSAALLVGCVKDIAPTEENTETLFSHTNKTAYVPNEVLVKFKSTTDQTARRSLLARISGAVQEQVVTAAMRSAGDNDGFYVVQTPLETMEAVGRLNKNADVEYAEPNWIYTYGTATNDTYWSNLWGMKGGFGSNAEAAWGTTFNNTGSSSVYVGVIDEGAMWNHEDLAGSFGNPGELGGVAGVDDDGNGLVDDIYGWDFVSNDNTVFDGTSDDHGTHVAGTINAKGNNGKGVAGVCWNIKLISAKFLGTNGGTTANAIKSVDYFTTLKSKGVNIVATSNSWGGGGYSQALHEAIIRGAKAGILFIAAAGNGGSDGIGDNNDNIASYPSNYNTMVGTSGETAATYDAVIAVASITSSGSRSSFSNFGAQTVDIGAPGSAIYSTVPSGRGKNVNSGYASYSGTSMATPHVSGAAALYASAKGMNAPTTVAQAQAIRNAILSSAAPTSSLSGITVTGGRLDANAALSK